jgi:hypothetical protein
LHSTQNRQETLAALADFARTRAFWTMTTGLSILIFSRVFGMGSFWHLVLNEGYVRLAKTTVEEGIELLPIRCGWLQASNTSLSPEYSEKAQPLRLSK